MKSKTKKKIRVYELYGCLNRWSLYTIDYVTQNENVMHVAAYSAKQAIYLANVRQWWVKGDRIGIIELATVSKDMQTVWTHADGSTSQFAYFDHYQTFDPSKMKEYIDDE